MCDAMMNTNCGAAILVPATPETVLDLHPMHEALRWAAYAAHLGEVPVGAVVLHQGRVVGRGYNRPIGQHDASAHAEMMALREASARLGNYRLPECELWVTLEPCMMCAGAIMHARLQRVVFGAWDPKTGCAGSVINLFAISQLNHHTQVCGPVLPEPCGAILSEFFRQRRAALRAEREQKNLGGGGHAVHEK